MITATVMPLYIFKAELHHNFSLKHIKVFPKWKRNLLNSVNLANSGNRINHSSMNWAHFKDLVSHMCLAGSILISYIRGHWVARSNPFTILTNIFVTANPVKAFREDSIVLSFPVSNDNRHLYFHVRNSCVIVCYIVSLHSFSCPINYMDTRQFFL